MSLTTRHETVNFVSRRVILFGLVVYDMWAKMTTGAVVVRTATMLECALYGAYILAMPRRRTTHRWFPLASAGMLVVTVCLSLFVQHNELGSTLTFFIAGMTGSRVRGKAAWWMGLPTFTGFLLMLIVVKPFGSAPLIAYIGYLAGLVGVYLGTLSAGVRRRAREAQQQYLRDLELAHQALQAAHRELQEASIQAMQAAVLAERNRIGREIHDSVGHALTSLVVQLQALQHRIRQDPQGAEQQVKALLRVTRQSLQEVRQAVRDVASAAPITSADALLALVHSVEANSRLSIDFHLPSQFDHWALETGVVIYRVLQEALTNVVRHSEATRVSIWLEPVDLPDGPAMRLIVEDNGKLRAFAPLAEGFGMQSMRSRCQDAGGSFHWRALEPHGMRIEAVIPWPGELAREAMQLAD
ncbi:sensor histidine kinase [Alicyclobacillus cycloheptanicus]|jgi:signal transduction histidine kinase|uniref:histidine kinase n=1 Tax=Alicyclobacillus cycloheptanicus TaxID=1457 RepID=A0ABT9XM43_9BACL|nr:sensor histidine kinase [Alicyclobacillus cycloheptanicus]MDQ0191382.1 signal transduction histidine kinase [Alicyclobacillus cycloheptanicus]WDM02353.1 sensor histidine kinase [Alicyclobacillus cycloheptanicus]